MKIAKAKPVRYTSDQYAKELETTLTQVEKNYLDQLVKELSQYQFHGPDHVKARRFMIRKLMAFGIQSIHTPYKLCTEMIGKLTEYTDLKNKKIGVLFNIEFVEVLINDFGVKADDIYYFADDVTELVAAAGLYGLQEGENLFLLDALGSKDAGKFITNSGENTMKFDVVVGNPPYQSDSGNKGAGNILWDKFVGIANDTLCKNSGNICLVHPSLWRKPNHKLREKISGLTYLEIHSNKDGLRTFGANTRYDWYVAQRGYKGLTIIKDQNGSVQKIDISKMSFIPNCDFELVKKLLPQNGEATAEILKSESAYEGRKDWMNGTKSSKFKYPCVYMVKANELALKWSSKNTNGHFGIPKIIYGSGEGCIGNFYIDHKGEYGMTQWASGIVDDPKNFTNIVKALKSQKFQEFCASISMSKIEINTSVLRCLRKDFWKEFLPKSEGGNLPD